jgi:galactitol-specific phosphotransferase system IIB component
MGTATMSKKKVEKALDSSDFKQIMRDTLADWLKNNPAAMQEALLSALRETGYEVKPIAENVDYGSEAFAKKHAVKWEVIEQLQELFKDEPPAEEILRIMRPEKYLETSNI